MADGVNAFSVYSSMELQINDFTQELNRASHILDSTLADMSRASSSLNLPPVEILTEADTSAVQDVESAVSGINAPPVTIHTETEPIEPVTVPPADDRNFIQKIKESFSNLKNTVNSVPSEIVGKFKAMGTDIVNNMKSFPLNFSEKFSEARANAVEKIKSLPSGLADIIASIPAKIGSGLKTIGTNISEAFKSGVESAKNSLKELPEKASEMLKETGEKLKSIAETVSKVALASVGAVSAAVTAFGKSAVDTGMDFDKSMSQVAATMGKSADEISELRDFAQEMGRTTAFSATDSANALNYMALAGYDAETAMSMLPNVLNLASAGGMDLALASDMITDSQSALGLSIDETTELVDKMAKASSKSNTSVSQLGDAILTVGGTAKKLKGGTTELTTILGILADNGIKGSEGGTALRNMMNSLISPTAEATAMLDTMGTSLYDSEGNMRSLNDVFLDLRNGMEGLATQAEKDQVLTTIFNARDLKSAEALIANVGDRFGELSAEIENSANASDAMAKTQLDNLAGDVTLFQSALEGAKIAISDHLTPSLRDFVKMGSDAMSEVALAFSNSDSFEEAIFKTGRYLQKYISQFIQKISEAIPKIITVATTLINSLGQAVIKNIPKFASSAVELLQGFAEGIANNAPTAIKGFSGMLKKVSEWLKTNSKTLISSGVEMIKSVSRGISENLPDIAETTAEIIGTVGRGIIENLPVLAESAMIILKSLGEYLIEKIPVLVSKAPEIIGTFATALSESGEAVVSVADSLMTKFAESIGLGGAWEKISSSVKGAFDEISKSFSGMKNSLKPVKNAFEEFKNIIFGTKTESGLLKKAVEFLCDVISEAVGIIGGIISGLMDFVTWLNSGSKEAEIMKNAIESIATAVGILLGGMALKGLVAMLPEVIGSIATLTATLVANAAAWISAAAPIVAVGAVLALVIYDIKMIADNLDELKEFFPLVFEDIKKSLAKTGEKISDFFTAIGDEIGGNLYDFVQDVKNFLGNIFDDVSYFFGNVADGFSIFIDNIKRFFSDAKDNFLSGIETIKTFFTGLKDHIRNAFDNIKNFISGLVDNWKSGVKSIKDGVENIVKKVADIPEAFGELVEGALNWGRDLIENFMQGAKEKIEAWNNFWEEVGFTIYDLLHHSTPEKGPLKDDDEWGGDLMDNLINGVKSKEKALSDTIKSVAENISETLGKPVKLNASLYAKGTLSGFEMPDISAETSVPVVAEGGYMTKYKGTLRPSVNENTSGEPPVAVENLTLNLNAEGMKFSSEYETKKFINFIAEQLKAKNLLDNSGVGGVVR